jgi:hypothetical protein
MGGGKGGEHVPAQSLDVDAGNDPGVAARGECPDVEVDAAARANPRATCNGASEVRHEINVVHVDDGEPVCRDGHVGVGCSSPPPTHLVNVGGGVQKTLGYEPCHGLLRGAMHR